MRRAVAVLLFVFTPLPGCQSWAAADGPLPTAPGTTETLRVQRHDGTRIVLYEATLRRDTLFGYDLPPLSRAEWIQPIAIPRARVDTYEVRRLDPGLTVLGVVGTAAALVLVGGWLCGMADCVSFDLGGR